MTNVENTTKRRIAVQSKTDRSYCPCTQTAVEAPFSVDAAEIYSAVDFSYAVRY